VTTDGQLTTLSGFPAVTGQGPRQIVAGPNNTLWATLDKPGDTANSNIARITGVETPPPPPPEPTPPDQTPITTPPPPDTTPPTVTAASRSKPRIRAGTRSVSFRFTLSEPAQVKLTIQRRLPGRSARYRTLGKLTRSGAKGANRIRFSGRIGKRSLRPGRYRALISATDAAGNRSTPKRTRFRVAAN
jgi:hypothetical protein